MRILCVLNFVLNTKDTNMHKPNMISGLLKLQSTDKQIGSFNIMRSFTSGEIRGGKKEFWLSSLVNEDGEKKVEERMATCSMLTLCCIGVPQKDILLHFSKEL